VAAQVTPPGELISVAGDRLHLVVEGRPDAPPVLLTSGLGGAWFDWLPTVDLLRDRHRVINFDRPGLGASPPLRGAPTLRAEAARLAALARWAGRPVIVAAHSYAAFHAEALARTCPDLVAGLILVDPSCESAARPRRLHLSGAVSPALRAVGGLAGATGAARLLGPWSRNQFMRRISHHDPIPPAIVRAVYGRGSVVGAAMVENVAYGEMAGDLIRLRRSRPFPEIPLTVLTALGDVRSPHREHAWVECHRRLAWMSPYGRQISLAGARHLLQTDRPDAVAEAVTEIRSRL
jgi:pimeloyl-ACP methyl ester carboxylesterase